MNQRERRAASEQHPDELDESIHRRNVIIGPCSCKHGADSPIFDESGNFYQRLRARFFNYLRRVAT